MQLWILLAIGSYLLLALNGVADKFLLSKSVKHPVAYAFYVGITGPFTLVLSLFGLAGKYLHLSFFQNTFSLQFLSFPDTMVALLAGACFPYALYFLYKAIQETSVSRVLPIEGGLVPFFTLILAYIILGERLTNYQIYAFFFLVLGAGLISLKKKKGEYHSIAMGSATTAAFLFAMSFVLTKYVFNQVNFGSGLIWTRFGFFLASVSFLATAKSRSYIFNAPKETTTGNKFVYLAARVSGGLSGFMQNYAISIGSVTLVNALQSTQYAFLLILTVFLSVKYPKILKEDVSKKIIVLKAVAIALISFGLWFLVK